MSVHDGKHAPILRATYSFAMILHASLSDHKGKVRSSFFFFHPLDFTFV